MPDKIKSKIYKNPKSEIRNTNGSTPLTISPERSRWTKQAQNSNYQNSKRFRKFEFWVLNLFRVSRLGFRVLFLVCLFTIFLKDGFCDVLRLKELPKDKEGSEVEILEEREDAFIIKVPKEEIEVIKKKRPTEIKAWQEKRILWEDTGDYITLYLPKERIVLPEGYTGKEYDSAKALKKELGSAGAEGRPEIATSWKGTGRILGIVLKDGRPLSGVKLKIVNVSPADTISRIFGPDEKKPEGFVLEAITDEVGRYEFNSAPLGEYDIYWAPSGSQNWYRRLSEKPDITVRPGETVKFPDIELK